MKFFLLFIACLGLSQAALKDELYELLDVLPLDEWEQISIRFREGDEQYQNVLRYLQDTDGGWAGLVGRVRDNEQWQRLKEFLLGYDVDLDVFIQTIHDKIQSLEIGDGGDLGGLRAFADECLEYFSLDDLAAKLDQLLTDSQDFRDLFEKISSDESRSFLEDFLFVDSEFVYIADTLTSAGIDLERVKEVLYEILGWI